MKKLILTFIVIFGAMMSLPARAAQVTQPVFFQNLADVPLMPGLAEAPESGVVFDKPEGRIVEATASSATLSRSAILTFYGTALPQLGWTQTAAGVYVRETENLTLAVDEKNGRRQVHITVTPRR